jgi:DHA1 family tetracycline resistance protein-like MFS transporter
MDQKSQNRAIAVLFLTTFIDLLEFGVIIPLLPFWALKLGASPLIYGILASAYSLMSFVFAPFWGKISDSKGRRPVILIGLIGTVIGLSLLSLTALIFTDSLLMLFIARIVGGLFTAATLPTSQAYIADTTSGKDRAKGFGLLGAAFGLGFALGPGIGGVLSAFGGYLLPAAFSTGLAIINLVAAIKYLPESLTEEVKEQKRLFKAEKSNETSIINLIVSKPQIYLTVILFAGISLAFSKMQSTLALLGKIRFGLDETASGVLFFIVGLVVVFTQAGLIRPLTNRFSDTTLIISGLFFLAIGFYGLSTVRSFFEMVIWIIPLAFGSSIANPNLSAYLSKNTPQRDSGVVLGFNQGLGSFMRIIGPLVGTAFFELNEAIPYYIGTVILIFGIFIAMRIAFISKKAIILSPCLNCGVLLQEQLFVVNVDSNHPN